MFEAKKDNNKTEMRTLTELLYGSIAVKQEQALSSKIFLWEYRSDLNMHSQLVQMPHL